MKEYKIPRSTFIGASFINNKLCDDLKSYFKKSPHNFKKNGTVGLDQTDKNIKDSMDMHLSGKETIYPFQEYLKELQKCLHRILIFMTYLNTVKDGGTFFKYQKLKIPAKKGLTLIWPSDWTHTHKGEISKTKEKFIVTGAFGFLE